MIFQKVPARRDIGGICIEMGVRSHSKLPPKVQNMVSNCKALCFCSKLTVSLHHWEKFDLIWPHTSGEKAPNAVVGLLLRKSAILHDCKTSGSNFSYCLGTMRSWKLKLCTKLQLYNDLKLTKYESCSPSQSWEINFTVSKTQTRAGGRRFFGGGSRRVYPRKYEEFKAQTLQEVASI
jgi:hypothetical protein